MDIWKKLSIVWLCLLGASVVVGLVWVLVKLSPDQWLRLGLLLGGIGGIIATLAACSNIWPTQGMD